MTSTLFRGTGFFVTFYIFLPKNLLNSEKLITFAKSDENLADILRKRLALFHPLNLDNSLYVGIDRRSSLMVIYLWYNDCLGCELFLYSHTGSPEPNGEYSSNWLTLPCMPDLEQ